GSAFFEIAALVGRAGRERRPACALGCGQAGLLTLLLLLAVDAERGHGPREEPLEADRFTAIFALVYRSVLHPLERAVALSEQPILAVAQPQLGREKLLLHGLVNRVAPDVAVAVHREGEALLGVAQETSFLCQQNRSKLGRLLFCQHLILMMGWTRP